MWSLTPLLLLTFAALLPSKGQAELVCVPWVPKYINWDTNLASGYLAKGSQEFQPNNNTTELLSFGQDSPLALTGDVPWQSSKFTLFNCTYPELNVTSRWRKRCLATPNVRHPTNTSERTDWLQIVSENNLCLTLVNITSLRTSLNYTECNKAPVDTRQFFPVTSFLSYKNGTCKGTPIAPSGVRAVSLDWQKKAFNPFTNSHWHLRHFEDDPYSVITLTKTTEANERYAYMVQHAA